MKQEFFIHGKPNNQDILGASGTPDSLSGLVYKESFERFDEEKKNYSYMRAELRSFSGIAHSVYTYCVPTVTDTSVRPSYFAMTLVSQGVYCNRMSELFSFFEKTYRLITGKLGVIDASSGKYQVNLFGEASGVNQLPSAALEEIGKNLSSYFVIIDKQFGSLKPKSEMEVSIEDCDSRSTLETLFKQGAIEISRNVESNEQASANLKKSQAENLRLRQQNEQLKQTDKSLAGVKKKLEEITAALSSANNTIDRLEEENKTLKNARKKSEDELNFVVGQLQEPLGKLMQRLGEARNNAKQSDKQWLRFSRFIPFINLVLILLLGYLCYKWTGNIKKNYSEEEHLEIIENEPQENWKDSTAHYRQLCERLSEEIQEAAESLSIAKEELARCNAAKVTPRRATTGAPTPKTEFNEQQIDKNKKDEKDKE